MLLTEISDRFSSKQWVALILEDCGSGQTFLITKLQQLQQLSVAEVTNTQAADLLPYELAHISVGLQSHLGRPVERNHLQEMNNIFSAELISVCPTFSLLAGSSVLGLSIPDLP